MNHLRSLWSEESGFILSIEMTLVATIAVIGLMAGISSLRDGVTSELSDVAGSIQDLNQSWMLYGVRGHSASTAGGDYIDRTDFCDSLDDAVNAMDNCITLNNINVIEENGALIHRPIGR